ncbi:MAG: NuoM family protein [Pyrinomonadaceae bacterium]
MKIPYLLSLITWLPAVGAALLLTLFGNNQTRFIKQFATAWFGLTFVVSLALCVYDKARGGMQFLEDAQWIPLIGARYQMGADGVAVLLILLTTLLGFLSALSSWSAIEKREKEYYVLLLVLQSFVVGVFASMDLFLFYLFFEVSLVPMYFLIGIWGGENRLYAAIKFFLYTLAGSVVMLLGVLKLYFLTQDAALASQISNASLDLVSGNANARALLDATVQAARANGTGTFSIMYLQSLGRVLPLNNLQVWLFAAFALAFAIKVPMFPFHTWLPDAHTEAPTAGSVILAGVLLKLGAYGFFRIGLPVFPAAAMDQNFFGRFGVRDVMVALALTSIIYGALAAMSFVVKKDGDVKKLVAYSSVSSMGIVMLGLFALNPNGITGATLHMINHGIYSAALFLLVGAIYERRHTRNIAEFGGLSHAMPGYATVFLIMALTAIGLPLLCAFISEFLAMRGAFEVNPYWAGVAALGMILNAGYMIWLYQRMFFGEAENPRNTRLKDLRGREWAYMMPLVFLSVWIGAYPTPFINFIARPVERVVRHIRPSYSFPQTLPASEAAAQRNAKP